MCSCVLCWFIGHQIGGGGTPGQARPPDGREAPCTVTDLAESAGMELSAVSHQLRLLRNLGLVTGTRSGKNIVYALYDNHVAALLDQAVYHIEHLRLGIADTPTARRQPEPADQGDAGAVTASAGRSGGS